MYSFKIRQKNLFTSINRLYNKIIILKLNYFDKYSLAQIFLISFNDIMVRGFSSHIIHRFADLVRVFQFAV